MTRSGAEPIRGKFSLIALISSGAILAACTANQPPPAPTYPVVSSYQPPPSRQPRPHNRAAASQTRDSAKPPPDAAPAQPAAGEAVALLASPPATAPETAGPGLGEAQEAPPAPRPTELTGLDQARATKLLGPATATESRGPATVWHYKSSTCELDLVFYMEMQSGQMRSLHYNFTGADNPQQRQFCLRAIVQENARTAASSQ